MYSSRFSRSHNKSTSISLSRSTGKTHRSRGASVLAALVFAGIVVAMAGLMGADITTERVAVARGSQGAQAVAGTVRPVAADASTKCQRGIHYEIVVEAGKSPRIETTDVCRQKATTRPLPAGWKTVAFQNTGVDWSLWGVQYPDPANSDMCKAGPLSNSTYACMVKVCMPIQRGAETTLTCSYSHVKEGEAIQAQKEIKSAGANMIDATRHDPDDVITRQEFDEAARRTLPPQMLQTSQLKPMADAYDVVQQKIDDCEQAGKDCTLLEKELEVVSARKTIEGIAQDMDDAKCASAAPPDPVKCRDLRIEDAQFQQKAANKEAELKELRDEQVRLEADRTKLDAERVTAAEQEVADKEAKLAACLAKSGNVAGKCAAEEAAAGKARSGLDATRIETADDAYARCVENDTRDNCDAERRAAVLATAVECRNTGSVDSDSCKRYEELVQCTADDAKEWKCKPGAQVIPGDDQRCKKTPPDAACIPAGGPSRQPADPRCQTDPAFAANPLNAAVCGRQGPGTFQTPPPGQTPPPNNGGGLASLLSGGNCTPQQKQQCASNPNSQACQACASPMQQLGNMLKGNQNGQQRQGGSGSGAGQQQQCQQAYSCQGNAVYYTAPPSCSPQISQQCPQGYVCSGNSCQQSPNGVGTDGQPCAAVQPQPAASACTVEGGWQPVRAANTCQTGWKCGSNTTGTGSATAQLSCQPSVVEPGMPISISWSCTNAASASANGFSTGGLLSSSTSTIAGALGLGQSADIVYGLTCTDAASQTVTTQCTVKNVSPWITFTSVPKDVTSGRSATLGWVTGGMKPDGCVVSSRDYADFTAANAVPEKRKANGSVTTPNLTRTSTFWLTCTTVGGNTKETSTTIGVVAQ